MNSNTTQLNLTGVEVAHIGSMLSGSAKVIVYGALPVQMDSLWKALHTQDINSIPLPIAMPIIHVFTISQKFCSHEVGIITNYLFESSIYAIVLSLAFTRC